MKKSKLVVLKKLARHRYTPLIFWAVVVFNAWFIGMGIISHGDWVYFHKETLVSLRSNYFSVWMSDYSFGRVLLDLSQAPTYGLYGIFAKHFGFSYALSERLIHLWPISIGAPVSAYLLANYLLKNKVGAYLSALIYSANSYFLILTTGHLTLAGAYALAPLALYLFMRVFDDFKLYRVCLSVLSLFIINSYEPRITYMIVIIFVIYSIFWSIENRKLLKEQKYKILAAGLLFSCLFSGFSIFWLLPLSKTGNLANNEVLNRGLFGDSFFNISNALTLFHPFWNFGDPISFVVQPIPLYFWLIPALAALGVFC